MGLPRGHAGVPGGRSHAQLRSQVGGGPGAARTHGELAQVRGWVKPTEIDNIWQNEPHDTRRS